MNDDLHNIDDFLRDRIEGHEEAVPDSVWDVVSNDLDKKQASYYKSKYFRLKWVALSLLLLCFTVGGYFVYEGLKNSGASTAQSAGLNTTIAPDAPNVSTNKKETSDSNSTTFNNKSTIENSQAVTPESSTINDTNVDTTSTASSMNEEMQEIARKEKSKIDTASILYTPSLLATRSKQLSAATTTLLKNNTRLEKNRYTNSNPSLKALETSTSYLSTVARVSNNYGFSISQLLPLQLTHKFNLPTSASPFIKTKNSTTHGLSLTAFAAPNINFNRLEDDDRFPGPRRHDAHQQEHHNFSMSGGLLVDYGLLKNLGIETGITITSSSTAIDAKTIYAKPDNNGHTRYELHCSTGYVYLAPKAGIQPAVGDSAKASGTTTSITYVTLPAAMLFHVGSGRFGFYPSLGVGWNILTGSQASTNLSIAAMKQTATSPINGLKPTYLDGHVGLGIEYNLSKKVSIGLRPNARLALTPINQNTPVKSYQNFLSVETGVRINF